MKPPPKTESLRPLAVECLRNRLTIGRVDKRFFPKAERTRDEIITTYRFILILEGELRYTIDGKSQRFGAGTQFLVPAWVRRVWTTPQGKGCTITWCEYDDANEEIRSLLLRRLSQKELTEERLAYTRLSAIFRRSSEEWRSLHLEAALKVMLTRFLQHASVPAASDQPARIHPRIKETLRWVQQHFMEHNALTGLMQASELSPNYLRTLFLEATLCTPHEYIEHLRLRHARYLLRETNWQLKRIAAEVGYDDPLYFSRLYRRFWKHAPSAERR